jgi:hypothetical protein
MAAPDTVVDFAEKLAAFDELWAPKIIGQVNDPRGLPQRPTGPPGPPRRCGGRRRGRR